MNILHAKRHLKNLWVEWVVFTISPINKGYDCKVHEGNGIQCGWLDYDFNDRVKSALVDPAKASRRFLEMHDATCREDGRYYDTPDWKDGIYFQTIHRRSSYEGGFLVPRHHLC